MKRRDFLGLIPVVPFFYSCSSKNSLTGSEDSFDAVFSGESSEISEVVSSQFSRIYSLAQNPGQEAIFGLEDSEGNLSALRLSMRGSGPVDYLHPVLKIGSKTAHMVFGWGTLAPTVKLVDSKGNEIAVVAKTSSCISEVVVGEEKEASMDLDSFLIYGIGLAAGSLAIWLGAKILGMVVAAAAFVAFNALLIGVVLAAIGTFEPAIKWVLDQFNLDTNDVEGFFNRGVGWISEVVQFISRRIEEGYST